MKFGFKICLNLLDRREKVHVSLHVELNKRQDHKLCDDSDIIWKVMRHEKLIYLLRIFQEFQPFMMTTTKTKIKMKKNIWGVLFKVLILIQRRGYSWKKGEKKIPMKINKKFSFVDCKLQVVTEKCFLKSLSNRKRFYFLFAGKFSVDFCWLPFVD